MSLINITIATKLLRVIWCWAIISIQTQEFVVVHHSAHFSHRQGPLQAPHWE